MAFCGLLFSPIVLLRQFGFIMVVGVLFDTFIMTPFIVPAVVTLLGPYNWDIKHLCIKEEGEEDLVYEPKYETQKDEEASTAVTEVTASTNPSRVNGVNIKKPNL